MVAYTNYLSDARPRREAETLARRGDRVDFIALADDSDATVENVNGVRLLRLKQHRYRGSSGLRYVGGYLRFIAASSFKVLRSFWHERYDVIYVHTMPDLLVFAGLIPKMLGAKVVLNIHDMMPELYMSKFGIPRRHWLVRLLALEEQCSIRLADKVVCVHHPHRDVLISRGVPIKKITVLPNVPDPSIMINGGTAQKTGGAFRIVFHGTIARRLGLELAVKAFESASGSCPCARLEIFGDGDAADALGVQIAASPVQNKISFSRKMFRVEAIAQMIQGASVGIIPNLRDVATDLMLPVKLLEYVHLGIPVIAPRLRTIEYYFTEDQVAYYEPGNAGELAACIRRLYLNPVERDALARHSMAFAESFNWEMFKEDLFKVVDA